MWCGLKIFGKIIVKWEPGKRNVKQGNHLAANIDGENSSDGSHPESEESVQLSHLI